VLGTVGVDDVGVGGVGEPEVELEFGATGLGGVFGETGLGGMAWPIWMKSVR